MSNHGQNTDFHDVNIGDRTALTGLEREQTRAAPRRGRPPGYRREMIQARRAVEAAEQAEFREELRGARREMRARRKNAKRRGARVAELAALLPASMVCPGCDTHRPRSRQWMLVRLEGLPALAACLSCGRKMTRS